MMLSKIGIQKKESNSDKIKYQMESKILLIMFSSSNKNWKVPIKMFKKLKL